MADLLSWIVLLLSSCIIPWIQSLTVKLGYLNSNGPVEEAVFDWAMEDLRNNGILPPSIDIQYTPSPPSCSRTATPGHAVELYKEKKVDAFIANVCSAGMEPTGKLAAYWNVPVVSFMTTSGIFLDKTLYKTYARVSITLNQLGDGIIDFLAWNNWNNVAIVWNVRHPVAKMVATSLKLRFEERNVKLLKEIPFYGPHYVTNFGNHRIEEDKIYTQDEALDEIETGGRIIILVLERDIYPTDDFMLAAHKRGLTSPEFVYLLPWAIKTNFKLPWKPNGKINETLRSVYSRTFVFVAHGADEESVMTFWEKLNNRTITNPKYNFTTTNPQVASFMVTAHDAVYLYGLALTECLGINGCDWRNGLDMFNRFRNKAFWGTSGEIIMGDNAERIVDYYVKQVQEDGSFKAMYHNHGQVKYDKDGKLSLTYNPSWVIEPNWGTENGKPPLDLPECGFSNEFCPVDYTTYGIIGSVALVLIISIAVYSVFQYKRKKYENALLAKSWQIENSQLQYKTDENKSQSLKFLGSLSGVSNFTFSSVTGIDGIPEKQFSPGFVGVAIYQCQNVAIKWYRKLDNFIVKERKDLILLKNLKELQHNNLNPFVGICMEERLHVIVAWQHCTKGSLADVLENEEITLDMIFKTSILRDVVAGLEFIHQSEIKTHGNLTIHNCLIDSHWTVKLTDFGLTEFMADYIKNGFLLQTMKSKECLMHLAPEILNQFEDQTFLGETTQEGDIYSLGMVMYQVLLRVSLFEDDPMSPEEILEAIGNVSCNMNGPKRPVIPQNHGYHGDLIFIIQQCWNEDREMRPKLSRVKRIVKNSTVASSENIFDHMIKMMTAYAENLEGLVHARTKQLHEEQNRADALLARMLPLSVAEKLKRGLTVEPETFDSVTIFFSDIVNFTGLCGMSNPIQIVQMLNQLYSLFDSVIAQFEAYKVETIGDAYLVVSGLPKRNGDRHSAEIANMSLCTREEISNFKIPHLPEWKVAVRIGLHTGSVAAGVVGLTMPRYCLFGDAVNMASRMESSGESMKIQISESCKTHLENQESGAVYAMTYRGKILLKGKGLCQSYWLEPKQEEEQERRIL